MAIYMKVTGRKQGWIKGSVGAGKFPDYIEVNTLEIGMGSPYDIHTGHTTGKRVPRAMTVTKPVDKSSPLLVQACDTNEVITVKVVYTKKGGMHKAYLTFELTDGIIRDFHHAGIANGTATETYSFSYTKCDYTWVDGGIATVLDWTTT